MLQQSHHFGPNCFFIALLFCIAGAASAEPEDLLRELKSQLGTVQAEIAKQERNIRLMREEVERATRENRMPRGEMLSEYYATATGERTASYHAADPRIQKMVDDFEDNFVGNSIDSGILGMGMANQKARFVVETGRSYRFVHEYLKPKEAALTKQIEALQNPYMDDEMRELLAEAKADEARDLKEIRATLDGISRKVNALRPRIDQFNERFAQSTLARRLRTEGYDEARDRMLESSVKLRVAVLEADQTYTQLNDSIPATLKKVDVALQKFKYELSILDRATGSKVAPENCRADRFSKVERTALEGSVDIVNSAYFRAQSARKKLASLTSDLGEQAARAHALRLQWAEGAKLVRDNESAIVDFELESAAIHERLAEIVRARAETNALAVELRPRVEKIAAELAAVNVNSVPDASLQSKHRELSNAVGAWRQQLARPIEDATTLPPSNFDQTAKNIRGMLARTDELSHLSEAAKASIANINRETANFGTTLERIDQHTESLTACVAALNTDTDRSDTQCRDSMVEQAEDKSKRFAQQARMSTPPSNSSADAAGLKAEATTLLEQRKIIERHALTFCETAQAGKQRGFDTGTKARLRPVAHEFDAAWVRLRDGWAALQAGTAPSGSTASKAGRNESLEALRRDTEASLVRARRRAAEIPNSDPCAKVMKQRIDTAINRYKRDRDALAKADGGAASSERELIINSVEPYFEDGREKYEQGMTCARFIAERLPGGVKQPVPAGGQPKVAADCTNPKQPLMVDGQPTCPCLWKNKSKMVFHPPTQQCQTEFYANSYEGSMKLKKALDRVDKVLER